jgi:hypothetical protein
MGLHDVHDHVTSSVDVDVDVEDLLIMMLQAARYSGHDATSQQAVLGQGVMGDG